MCCENLLFGKLLILKVFQNENFDYLMVDHFGIFLLKKVYTFFSFLVLIS